MPATDKGKGAYFAPSKKTPPTKLKGIVISELISSASFISVAEGEELEGSPAAQHLQEV